MAKLFIGLVVGCIIGAVAVVGAWFLFLDMTVPFTRESLDRHPDMKLFVHDVTTFQSGSFDTDEYRTWFSFRSGITTATDYFTRLDAAIRDTEWKLLDSHGGFRLYVTKWEPAAPSAVRLERAISFDSQTRTVRLEERRQYE